jgi:hypothetical protein
LIENIEYNTERKQLIIPEYGRHIHKMIDHALTIEDKEEQRKVVVSIVDVMGNMNPHLRDVADFQHKLWDQLFIMSDFQLDVASPFSKPSKEVLSQRPEPLPYPQKQPKYRFYGNNIKSMIDVARSWEEGELKVKLVVSIANHMKKCFLNWNKDTVEDAVIFHHLYELSDGTLNLKDSSLELVSTAEVLKSNVKKTYKKPQQKSSNHKGHHQRNNKTRNKKRY